MIKSINDVCREKIINEHDNSKLRKLTKIPYVRQVIFSDWYKMLFYYGLTDEKLKKDSILFENRLSDGNTSIYNMESAIPVCIFSCIDYNLLSLMDKCVLMEELEKFEQENQ